MKKKNRSSEKSQASTTASGEWKVSKEATADGKIEIGGLTDLNSTGGAVKTEGGDADRVPKPDGGDDSQKPASDAEPPSDLFSAPAVPSAEKPLVSQPITDAGETF